MRRNNELPNSALIGARMSKWAVTEWLLISIVTMLLSSEYFRSATSRVSDIEERTLACHHIHKYTRISRYADVCIPYIRYIANSIIAIHSRSHLKGIEFILKR